MLLAQRIMRMFDMYFSIVLRRAAWASRERESASLIITTGRFPELISLQRDMKPTLEPLFRVEVNLLCLSNFFEEFLNDDAVIVSSITIAFQRNL